MAIIVCIAGRKSLARALGGIAGDLGHVTVASNARELMQDLTERKPGAVIIDREAVRGREKGLIRVLTSKDIPVMVVTSHLNAALLTCDPPADVYMEKPCSAKELLACAVEMIRIHDACRSVAEECSAANAAGRT